MRWWVLWWLALRASMGKHRHGYTVEHTITRVYLRDPRVEGIVKGALWGLMTTLVPHIEFDVHDFFDEVVTGLEDDRV